MEMDLDLEEIILYLNANEPTGRFCKNIENLKNKLLKAQEQEKVLSIIKEKNVDISLLKECKNESEYNIEVQCHNENLMKPLEWWIRGKLTQEEFDLLKRC